MGKWENENTKCNIVSRQKTNPKTMKKLILYPKYPEEKKLKSDGN